MPDITTIRVILPRPTETRITVGGISHNVTDWGDITGTLSDQTDLQAALDAKEDALGFTPENVANKSTSTSLGTSDTLYPSQKAVKTYVDNQVGSGVSSWNGRTGAVVPVANDYSEDKISFTDITTNNVSTTKHGYQPKLPDDSTLFFNGVGDYVAIPASGGGSTSQRISGGGVAWTGTGYSYIISACTYLINGVQYTSTETPVTLDPADLTLNRVDTFYVDIDGLAGVITGDLAVNPVAPSVDPASQLFLTTADINANTTEPTITVVDIYLEDTEYTMSTNSAGTINLASTNNPYAGTKCIEGTNVAKDSYFTAVKPSGTLNLSTYQSLIFQIRSKATWPNAKSISIFWMNGAAVVGTSVALRQGVFGFDSSQTSTYQQIVIPISQFNTGTTVIDRLRMVVAGGAANIGWYIDNIIIQSGPGGGGGGGSGDFSTNVNVSVAGELVSFADTTGKLGTRSTGTGIATLASGVLGATPDNHANWDTAYTDRLKWDGGATGLTAATGRTSLGGTTVGQNVFTLTNPSAITFPRINADNSVDALNASDFRTAIGAGTGGGDVSSDTATSVDAEVALFKSTTGKLIKRATGTGIATLSSGVLGTITPGSGIETFLATPSSANLRAAVTDETGSGGALVFATSPTITTPTIAKIANLTSNGFVTTSGGDGTLGVDTLPHSVTFAVDGAGTVLTTGTKNPIKIPYGGTLQGWLLIASPSGLITVDIYRAADGAGLPVTSIVGGSGTKPALSSAVENSSTSFTNWTSTTLTAKDNMAINLSGITTCTYVCLTLYFK